MGDFCFFYKEYVIAIDFFMFLCYYVNLEFEMTLGEGYKISSKESYGKKLKQIKNSAISFR